MILASGGWSGDAAQHPAAPPTCGAPNSPLTCSTPDSPPPPAVVPPTAPPQSMSRPQVSALLRLSSPAVATLDVPGLSTHRRAGWRPPFHEIRASSLVTGHSTPGQPVVSCLVYRGGDRGLENVTEH